jgi:nucleoside-diphosphate-sugar epimerase
MLSIISRSSSLSLTTTNTNALQTQIQNTELTKTKFSKIENEKDCVNKISKDQAVVIAGPTSQLGQRVMKQALEEGYPVLTIGRKGSDFLTKLQEKFPNTFKVWTIDDCTDRAKWKACIEKYLQQSPCSNLLFVNAIGSPHVGEENSIRKANVDIAKAAFTGVNEAARAADVSCANVQLSSIASLLVEDAYGKTKKEAEEFLMLEKLVEKLLVLRVGYALEDMKIENRTAIINNHHAWSPEHMAGLFVQFIIGDGTQPLQPVAISDIVKAIFNAPNVEGKKVVNAVGEQVKTQIEFIKFFRDLKGLPSRFVHLPTRVLKEVVHYISKGHCAPYAVEVCEKYQGKNADKAILSHEDFEKIVGEKLKTIEDLYSPSEKNQIKAILFARPPVMEHTKEIIKTFRDNPKFRIACLKAFKKLFDKEITKQISEAKEQAKTI